MQARRQLHQSFATRKVQGAAGRVLEIWQCIQKARAFGQFGRDRLWNQATFVGGYRYIIGLIKAERLQGAQVAWVFYQDVAAFIDKNLAQQIKRLLRAGHNQNLVCASLGACAIQIVCHSLAQRTVTFGEAILQCSTTVGRQYFIKSGAHHFDGKTARSR